VHPTVLKVIDVDSESSDDENENENGSNDESSSSKEEEQIEIQTLSSLFKDCNPPEEDITHFIVLDEILDNHFMSMKNSPISPEFASTLMKEYSLIQSSLPDQIYIVGYSSRSDILKAIIFGPPNTPYYLSCFEFDIYLPASTYPKLPPKVYYHARNHRLNPNLHTSGYICLSLLGTWKGEGVEIWNPNSSNLLQVLVSIQGLILGTDEPYFLEAGYDSKKGTEEGDKLSKVYNQDVIILSFKHITSLLCNPPVHFLEILKKYYISKRSTFKKLQKSLEKLSKKKEMTSKDNNLLSMFMINDVSQGFFQYLESVLPTLISILYSL